MFKKIPFFTKLIPIENKIGKTLPELEMSGFSMADVLQKIGEGVGQIETREIYYQMLDVRINDFVSSEIFDNLNTASALTSFIRNAF